MNTDVSTPHARPRSRSARGGDPEARGRRLSDECAPRWSRSPHDRRGGTAAHTTRAARRGGFASDRTLSELTRTPRAGGSLIGFYTRIRTSPPARPPTSRARLAQPTYVIISVNGGTPGDITVGTSATIDRGRPRRA